MNLFLVRLCFFVLILGGPVQISWAQGQIDTIPGKSASTIASASPKAQSFLSFSIGMADIPLSEQIKELALSESIAPESFVREFIQAQPLVAIAFEHQTKKSFFISVGLALQGLGRITTFELESEMKTENILGRNSLFVLHAGIGYDLIRDHKWMLIPMGRILFGGGKNPSIVEAKNYFESTEDQQGEIFLSNFFLSGLALDLRIGKTFGKFGLQVAPGFKWHAADKQSPRVRPSLSLIAYKVIS